ncbi:MAG TPA: class E sortase [Solirubrobacteraceae bacterium]|nr:class E sortase [Solirubrobacteraceae bacterium]
MSRIVRGISTLLILVGGLLGADVIATLLWQEPVTAVISLVRRAETDTRAHTLTLDRADRRILAAIHRSDARIAFLAAREGREVPAGAPLGRVSIPAIGVREPLIQGTATASLALGTGHYATTALPGEGATVAVAGHRTTYLAPFRDLNELTPGASVILTMPYGRFTYTVQRQMIVAPDAWWIVRDVGYERLVLSSCNPLFSASQRIVVFARLSAETPVGPARTGASGRTDDLGHATVQSA